MPGEWLRAAAARVCSTTTLERLVDPIVADLQREYGIAVRNGRAWKARRILIASYVAFAKAAFLHGCQRSMQTVTEWSADDRRALGRALWISVAAAAVAILLLAIPPLARTFSRARARSLVYLIPQGLPIGIPIGVSLGILFGLRSRAVSRRIMTAVLAASILFSVVSLGAFVSVIPASNQAFRETIFDGHVAKGLAELTLGELRQQIDGRSSSSVLAFDPTLAALHYHTRWALSWATFVFALFALSVVTRRSKGSFVLGISAIGAYFGYYAVLAFGRGLALDGDLSPLAGAWLPNIVLTLIAVTITSMTSKRSAAA